MNIKKLSLLGLICFSLPLTHVQAQKKKSSEPEKTTSQPAENTAKPESERTALLKSMLNESLRFGDLQVAKSALYEMMQLLPEEKTLKDSLAFLYFKMEAFPQCILVSREILKERPESMEILEIKAISEQSLGMAKESLESYESLEKNSKSLYHAYQIATLQFQLKRFGECVSTIDRVLNNAKADDTKINIVISQNQEQEVPIKAAMLNMKGVMALETNDENLAKKFFEESLKTAPEFVLPKANLEVIAKKSQPATKPKPGK